MFIRYSLGDGKIWGWGFSMFFPHLVGACDDWVHRGISSKIRCNFVLFPECLSCARCFKYDVNQSIGFSTVQMGLPFMKWGGMLL